MCNEIDNLTNSVTQLKSKLRSKIKTLRRKGHIKLDCINEPSVQMETIRDLISGVCVRKYEP